MVSSCLSAPKVKEMFILQPEPIKQFDSILYAFEMTESNQREDAVNPSGAVGVLQLMPIMVDEANRICRITGNPSRFTYSDRLDSVKSVRMWYITNAYHNPNYTVEGAVKLWNSRGGEKYINKIKSWL